LSKSCQKAVKKDVKKISLKRVGEEEEAEREGEEEEEEQDL
jgi:hypothetical protein